MSEPDEQTGPSWEDGILRSAFDKEWRKLTSSREQHLGIKDSVLLITETMTALRRITDDCVHRSNGVSGRSQHDRMKGLILAVQTSVTNTLQSILRPQDSRSSIKQGIKNLLRAAEHPAPQVDVERFGRAVQNGLSEVEKVLGIEDPPTLQPMSEAKRLLELLQELLKAKVLEKPEMALETIDRLRLFLRSEGIEVVDYKPQSHSDVDKYFDFDNEADRSAGGGYLKTPALVQVSPRRVLRRGRVGTTTFDQPDRASDGTSNGQEQAL
ncbi:MAG: hypothetical protein ACRDTA_05295 [Pseudonocardiaceae bacterium]